MHAHASVVAGPGNGPGATCYRTLRSDPPLLLRPTPTGLYLMGGAAGPLGGDRLHLDIHVLAGAALTVRSVAASLILPGNDVSDLRIEARVDDDAVLDWAPEPTVSVAGSRHRQRVDVDIAAGARLRWAETLVLGRTGEPGGAMDATLRVTQSGRAVMHQQLAWGATVPGWDGAASLGAYRVVASEATVRHGGRAEQRPLGTTDDPDSGVRAMAVDLGDDAIFTQVLAPDVPAALAVW